MIDCGGNYNIIKEMAIDICTMLGDGDPHLGSGILISMCSFLRVARMKHKRKNQTKQKLFEDFLAEVEELKDAYEGKHRHDFDAELMDCITVLIRLWNEEYSKETNSATDYEWVRETRV